MTYIVIQAIEIEADSPTDAVDQLENQFEFPYFVQPANEETRASIEAAIKTATEVSA